jgi:hypothetical protein
MFAHLVICLFITIDLMRHASKQTIAVTLYSVNFVAA